MLEAINTHLAHGQGVIVTPGELVLLHPEDPDGRTWLALTPTDDITVVDTDEVRLSGDRLDEQELLRRLVTAQQVTAERSRLAEGQLQELQERIVEIRAYAIDRHREGAFCRQGLNDALEHFGMDPYSPRYSLEVVVHATVEINADSAAEAERRFHYVLDGLDCSGETNDEELEVQMTAVDIQGVEAV